MQWKYVDHNPPTPAHQSTNFKDIWKKKVPNSITLIRGLTRKFTSKIRRKQSHAMPKSGWWMHLIVMW